jgi:hypothetical protein
MKRAVVSLLALMFVCLSFAPRSDGQIGSPSVCGETILALTANGRLIRFSTNLPGVLQSNVAISGLQAGESLVGIDFRPRNRLLYGVSNQNAIYTIDPATGAATAAGSLSTALTGTVFGFDFNPRADRLRIVSDAGQNLRIDVTAQTNNTTSDLPLMYASADVNGGATPRVVGSAYTNSFDGTPATLLYGIDSNLDILVTQDPPNNGTLNTIGGLGVNTGDSVAFDISSASARAFASLTIAGNSSSGLYSINLGTGSATLLGAIGIAQPIIGMTVASRPVTVFAVTTDNRLLTFDSLTPGLLTRTNTIKGLSRGESILGIDFRPANGLLYALSTFAITYTIDTQTGVVSKLPVSSPLGNAFVGNTAHGFDFNPQVDRIRIVNKFEQNYRLVPTDGSLAGIDLNLGYNVSPGDANLGQNPSIVGSAYSNNFAGTTSTILYGIDSGLNVLVTQNPPNNGVLNTVGALKDEATQATVDVTDILAFDIFGCDPIGLIAATRPGDTASRLYRVNLGTGAVVQIGIIGGGGFVSSMAVK